MPTLFVPLAWSAGIPNNINAGTVIIDPAAGYGVHESTDSPRGHQHSGAPPNQRDVRRV